MRFDRRTSRVLGLAWGFGWRIGAGVLLGFYLDRWVETSPLFLFVFAIGSLVAGIAELIRAAAADARRDEPRS